MDNLTVQFLRNASNVLKQSKSCEKIDQIIYQLRLKSLDFSTCVPNEINSSEMCIHCGNPWRDGLFSLLVKCHQNKKIKKQRKVKKDNITILSPCRKDYLAYYKSLKDNALVKKCLVCKSITRYSMSKPFTEVKKETASLQCVEDQNLINKKRKRKSGKKQSFAGLSPLAVLQARLSCTKVYNASIPDKIYEPSDLKEISNLTKKNLLSNKAVNMDKITSFTTVPQSASSNNISLGVPQGKVKKQKLKDGATILTGKKSKKRKKKSFLSELQSLL